jgi:hypothetical protein
MIFYGAVFVVSLLLLDRFIFVPIVSKINLYNKKIDEEKSMIKNNLRVLDQKEKIKNEETQFSSYYPGENKLSREKEVAYLLKEVENMAKDFLLGL